jgi:hypothetical protein
MYFGMGVLMSDHIHQPQTHVEYIWKECVTPVECAVSPVRAEAHGGIAFVDTCECGAIRMGERGPQRVNVGDWVSTEQVKTVKEAIAEAAEPELASVDEPEPAPTKGKDKKSSS